METLKLFLVGVPVFVAIDYVWLAIIAKRYYLTSLAPFIKVENGSLVVNFGGAAVVYVVAVLAIIAFVLPRSTTVGEAALIGALLGFVMYAFYDFTNYATLNGYPLTLALVDTAWGTLLFASVAAILFWTQKITG